MGTPLRRKTNSESFQRRLLSNLQAGEERTLSSNSLFFLNDAHLNSSSNGTGGLPEPPHIASFSDVTTQRNPNHWSCPRKPSHIQY